jgi:hypothetical protein
MLHGSAHASLSPYAACTASTNVVTWSSSYNDLDLAAGRLSMRQTITLVDHKIVTAPRTETGCAA